MLGRGGGSGASLTPGNSGEGAGVAPSVTLSATRSKASASADRHFQRILEAEDLAVALRRVGLGVLLEQERRDRGLVAADHVVGLVGEQLDAAGGVEHVRHADLLALGL